MLKTLLMATMLLLPITSFGKTIVLTPDNTLSLSGPVTSQSMADLKVQLLRKYYNVLGPKELYLVLDTPGGSVPDGDQFIDFAKSLNIKIHTVTLFSASMGFHILQNLDNRYVMAGSTLMSHRASLQLSGELYGEFDSMLSYIKRTVKRLDHRIAKRMNMKYSKYQNLIRDELWLDGVDSVKIGAADEVVKVVCSSDFKGVRTKNIRTMFGIMKVNMHACPLINSPVSIDTSNISNKYVANNLVLMYTNKRKFVNKFISNPKGYSRFKVWMGLGN